MHKRKKSFKKKNAKKFPNKDKKKKWKMIYQELFSKVIFEKKRPFSNFDSASFNNTANKGIFPE